MKHIDLPSVDRALASFLEIVEPLKRTMTVLLEDADDRVLSKDILAPMDYPHYDQCILDGYAVQAADTANCGAGSTKELSLITEGPVNSGFCMTAHTGSALPPGADALLRLEAATESAGRILASEEVTKGKWIWPRGGGIREGSIVNREGMHLKPTDIAMLAKLGISRVEVYEKPQVLIVPTGDECIRRGDEIAPGFVYETNGLMCSLLVKRYGGSSTLHDIVPDNEALLRDVLLKGASHDLIVTIGGSSAGGRDLMEQAVASMGEVLFHGVALHPGNHMGTGFVKIAGKRTPVLFLPGYTESCAVAAFTFVDAAVRRLGHLPPSCHPVHQAELAERMVTSLGMRAVRKVNIQDGKARPIKLLGESALSGRFGYVVVPEDRAVFERGEFVEAIHFE